MGFPQLAAWLTFSLKSSKSSENLIIACFPATGQIYRNEPQSAISAAVADTDAAEQVKQLEQFLDSLAYCTFFPLADADDGIGSVWY